MVVAGAQPLASQCQIGPRTLEHSKSRLITQRVAGLAGESLLAYECLTRIDTLLPRCLGFVVLLTHPVAVGKSGGQCLGPRWPRRHLCL